MPAPDVPLLTSADALPDASPATQDDLASILFTSGTTVAPKAVPLTHGNYLANVRDLVPLMEIHRERVLSVLPVHHVFEQTVGQLVPLCGASTISYVSALEPDEIKWMMSTTRPTVMVVIPRLLQLLHAGIFRSVEEGGAFLKGYFKVAFALSKLTGGRAGPKLFSKVHQRFGGSLRRIATGGTALDPELGRSFFYMGFRVGEGYGMTETSPVLTVNQWDRIRFGTAGEPIPSVEIDLRPSSEIAADAAAAGGEIWVRGPNVMSGYYRNEEATAAVMESGWLNTGDVGYFDASGHLVVCGRTKEVIVTEAGKNVYPDEVERRYADLEPVGELVVVGLPAAGGQGEVVAAVITPKTPDATQDQIDEAIRERSTAVPSYQRIGRIVHWQGELPKTTTMKVKRAALRRALLSGETRGTAKTQAAAATAAAAAAPLDRDQQWTVDTLARLVRTRSDQVRAEHQLSQLGVDSLTRVELVAAVEQHFDIEVDDTAALSMDRVQDLFDLVASGVSANASENTATATVAS